MRRNILILLLLVTAVCQAQYEPSIRDVVESELPTAWQNLKEIYVWEGDDFKEFEVKKAPISDLACKALGIPQSEAPLCYFLFDKEGNKTPYFLGRYLYIESGKDDLMVFISIRNTKENKFRHIEESSEHMKNFSLFFIMLYEEGSDSSGNYLLKERGHPAGPIDKMIFYEKDSKHTVKTFFGDIMVTKKYNLSYNKDRTTLFLHYMPEE